MLGTFFPQSVACVFIFLTVSFKEHFLTLVCVLVTLVAQSCPTLCDPMDCSPWNSPGQNTGVSSLSLLQPIFPTQESTRGLLHCRRILYQLSYQGSPPRSIFVCICSHLWVCDPGEGNGNPLQYSCLENPMDRGACLVGCSPWHREGRT